MTTKTSLHLLIQGMIDAHQSVRKTTLLDGETVTHVLSGGLTPDTLTATWSDRTIQVEWNIALIDEEWTLGEPRITELVETSLD